MNCGNISSQEDDFMTAVTITLYFLSETETENRKQKRMFTFRFNPSALFYEARNPSEVRLSAWCKWIVLS